MFLKANVNIKNQSDVEEESLEMQDISKPKVWSESEKPQRPSLLQRIRSSRSKSKDEPSSGEESEPEPEEESSIGEEDEAGNRYVRHLRFRVHEQKPGRSPGHAARPLWLPRHAHRGSRKC